MSLTPQSPDDEPSVDLLAASFRADAQDSETLLEALAVKLTGALPGVAAVQRGGWRGKGPVQSLTVVLGDRRLTIANVNRQLAARIDTVAAGIAIKHVECSVDEWLGELASQLTLLAERDGRARNALSQLLIG